MSEAEAIARALASEPQHYDAYTCHFCRAAIWEYGTDTLGPDDDPLNDSAVFARLAHNTDCLWMRAYRWSQEHPE